MKISVVTPSFNQGIYIEETINSILDQKYPDLEYIIIDGGSNDCTVPLLNTYTNQISYWISEPDNGQSHAINKGWSIASGDILAWLNADDTYLPDTLQHVTDIFTRNPDVMILSGAGLTSFENSHHPSQYRPPSNLDPHLLLASCGAVPLQPSLFIRREVFERVGPLNENLHYVMDWEYWIRVGLAYPQHQIMKTVRPLAVNREWNGTKTNMGWRQICIEHLQVLDKIFASNKKISPNIKASAYRSCYRKAAELARTNGETREALRQIYKAWLIDPLSHNPMRELVLLLYIFLGPSHTTALKDKTSYIRKIIGDKIEY